MNTARCAYFDMDGTLLSGKTVRLYLRWLRELGFVTRLDGLRLLLWSVTYRLGLFQSEDGLAWIISRLEGVQQGWLLDEGRRWYEEALRPLIFEPARQAVRAHQDAGHRVAILTASSDFVAAPLADDLGVAPEDLLCTRFEVVEGRLTGSALRPICYGAGKVGVARAHALQWGCDLSRSWFYSDSITDRPMLEEVGLPRVVNPDPPLQRLAARRAWPVSWFDGSA